MNEKVKTKAHQLQANVSAFIIDEWRLVWYTNYTMR